MVSAQASTGTASQSAAAGASQEKGLNLNGAAAASEELSGPMLEPSAFNKNWVSIHNAAHYSSSSQWWLVQYEQWLYRIGLSVNAGAIVLPSF